ncbi:MAG: YlqD family protein [Selenomonadaceae bacterium]
MDSVSLKCPVTIKAKVTEALKKHMLEEMKSNIEKVDLELQQIDIQAKRVLGQQAQENIQGVAGIRQQVEMEKQKRFEFKQQVEQKIEETEHLEIGAEIVQGTLERIVEVKVGDDMRELMNVEILVEDGKIIALRS